MSFDPRDNSTDPVPPRRPADDEGFSPTPPEQGLKPAAAREHVLLPGIFLLAMAVLNVLWSFGFFGYGFIAMNTTPEAFEQAMKQQNPAQAEEMRKLGWEPANVLRNVQFGSFGGGILVVVLSLLCVIGAIRMLMLRSYGLALFTAVVTAVPCVSPMACPCLLGMGIGVWAMVVLLNPDVRSAFR